MPMIDVYAPGGAFEDNHELARRLAAAVAAARRELGKGWAGE